MGQARRGNWSRKRETSEGTGDWRDLEVLASRTQGIFALEVRWKRRKEVMVKDRRHSMVENNIVQGTVRRCSGQVHGS